MTDQPDFLVTMTDQHRWDWLGCNGHPEPKGNETMAILGNISNGFDRFIKGREKKAELIVHAYLASLDDATLTRLGVSRKDLKPGGRMTHFI